MYFKGVEISCPTELTSLDKGNFTYIRTIQTPQINDNRKWVLLLSKSKYLPPPLVNGTDCKVKIIYSKIRLTKNLLPNKFADGYDEHHL